MYPYANPKNPITDFRYYDWLHLGRSPESLFKEDREILYVVMQDYRVSMMIAGHKHMILVPKGMTTDLASVPKVFRNIVGRVGPHLEACIVHDWLYVAWQFQNRLPNTDDWEFANEVLYAGLKAANCSWVTRTAIRLAMKFSWGAYKGRNKNILVQALS